MNGILRNWESLCDIRPDCHHHFDASGTSNAMFDELAERSLMSPLAGTKHTYVRLAIIIYCQIKIFIQDNPFNLISTGIKGVRVIKIILLLVEPMPLMCDLQLSSLRLLIETA